MLPLAGIRVLDLSRLLAGPFCTTILGDLGADVIKVEALPGGDLSRGTPPSDRGESVFFLSVNRNKRSVAIDFRRPDGLDLIRELAAASDVVVQNFKPGTMEDMGLDYETLKANNPRLVFAGVSGFGRTGPYGRLPGVDQIAQGMSGLMSITGQVETGATRVGIPIGDLVAGMWTALGVQAALIARTTTGLGQRVDTSLLASLIGLLCMQGQRFLSLGDVPEVADNHHPLSSPYGLFHAKDGPFNFSATTPGMWDKLCRHLDLEWMLGDPRFSTSAARRENRKELERLLGERFAQRGKQDWIEELRQLGMPAGPLYNLSEVFADPQVQHSRMVETIDHPTLGKLLQLASPIGLDCFAEGSVRRPPPRLGEHTVEVLTEFGLSPERLAELADKKVIESSR